MTISSVLCRSAVVHASKSFLTINLSNKEKNSDIMVVEYEQAPNTLRRYGKWIVQQLVEAMVASSFCHDSVEIIVAFLSTNTPELVLAIMAALDIYVRLRTTQANNYSDDSSIQVAMLNARWTPQENAAVLQVSTDSSHLDDKKHVTLLLYGEGFETIAKDTKDIIRKVDVETHHTMMVAEIPSIDVILNEADIEQTASYSTQELFFCCSEDLLSISNDSYQNHNQSWMKDAIILFTSGTTSTYSPKGVKLSHASLLIQSTAKLIPPCSYDHNTVLLGDIIPFFHVGGLSSMIAVIMAGGSIYFSRRKQGSLQQPFSSFFPAATINTLQSTDNTENNDVNTLVLVPAMLHSLIQEIFSCEHSLSIAANNKVRLIVIGGSSASPFLLEQSRKVFPHARIVQTYACSEAGSSLTFLDVSDASSAKLDPTGNSCPIAGNYVGVPPPHIQIKLLSQDMNCSSNGSNCTSVEKQIQWTVRPYEIGLICTRGLHVMNGYWRRQNVGDRKDPEPFFQGWLKTEDMGFLDERGGLYFCGRCTDVIRTGGETVFPMEVEGIISLHKDVDSCVVFGLPDDRLGEAVSAAVVLNKLPKTSSLSPLKVREVRQHCKDHNLAGYKCPRAIFIVKEIPKNQSGKVLKKQLVANILLSLKGGNEKPLCSKL